MNPVTANRVLEFYMSAPDEKAVLQKVVRRSGNQVVEIKQPFNVRKGYVAQRALCISLLLAKHQLSGTGQTATTSVGSSDEADTWVRTLSQALESRQVPAKWWEHVRDFIQCRPISCERIRTTRRERNEVRYRPNEQPIDGLHLYRVDGEHIEELQGDALLKFACELEAEAWENRLVPNPIAPSMAGQILSEHHDFPQIEVDTHTQKVLIRKSREAVVCLPRNPPEMSAKFGAKAAVNAKHWKRVHSLAEKTYAKFREVHIQMLHYHRGGDLTAIQVANQLLDQAGDELNEFCGEMEQLPETVKNAEHILLMRQVPEGMGALRRTFASMDLHAPHFEKALYFVELICTYSFECLTRADRMLELFWQSDQRRR